MQQEALHSQIPPQMPPAEAHMHGPVPSSRDVGFVPFHQQGQQSLPKNPEHLPVTPQPEPSLSLRLEQPDSHAGVPPYGEQFQQGGIMQLSTSPAVARPSTVRPFDLEQSLQHTENPEHSALYMHHSHVTEHLHTYRGQAADIHHGNEDSEPVYSHHGTTEALQGHDMENQHVEDGENLEQAENLQLQIIPASLHDQSEGREYPLPQATHEAVIHDKELFMTTLDDFLAALGTRLTILKLGNKDLDLHALYREVTALGGLEQVIRYSRWKELVQVLGVSLPSLSAAFVLRKHYTNLLFHYEQVYFFRIEGQLKGFPVPLPAPSPVVPAMDVGSPYEVPPEIGAALKKRKRKIDPMQVFGVDPAASVGATVTGAINGKFDEGYLVTVVVGAEKLTGVLYHVSGDAKVKQFASVPSLLEGVGSDLDPPGLEIQLFGRKKREVRKKDPNAPRRTRTGYNIFFKEQRALLKQRYPESKGLGKKVIEMWGRLPESEKALYIERGNKEREKFKKELADYQERAKQQSQSCDGTNLSGQPAPAEHELGSYDVSHDYHVSLEVDGDAMAFQGSQAQMPEIDQGYHANDSGAGYHLNGSQAQPHESETSGGHMDSEQAYNMHEDEGNYPNEAESEEEGDEEEEAYGDEEEEAAYPGSEQGYDEQDGSEYPPSDQAYNVPEGMYPPHAGDAEVHETEVHGGSEQQYYEQGHGYAYRPSLPQLQGHESQGPGGMAANEQVAYQQMIDNGQVLHPHLQQGHPDVAGAGVSPQQQYYPPNKFIYAQARQAQTAEALGVPVSSDQPAYHRQDEVPYSAHLQHQNQAMGPNLQSRQVAPEQAYQDRYPYPIHMPYAPMYPRPHAYPPMRFPHHVHPYPMHLAESQALQFGHPFAPQIHQPQASTPEISGAAAPPQLYPIQDGGHVVYHTQEASQSVPVYKHGSQG